MKPNANFLHSLFEVAHVEFQTYDLANHRVVFSSGVANKLLGYTEQEYLSLSLDAYNNIVHPDDREKVRQMIEKIKHAPNGDVIEMTVRLCKKDGSYLWVYSRQMVYERDEHNVCTIIREVEDVSKLMKLQDELKEKIEVLETISFKNSHLLRSPVASIIGLVDLIEEQSITSDHNRQVMHFLKDAITKLDQVVHEINNVARS